MYGTSIKIKVIQRLDFQATLHAFYVLAIFSQLASKTKTSNWFPMFPLNSLNSSLSDPSASGRWNSSSNPLRMCSLLQVTPQVRIPSGKYTKTLSKLFLIQNSQKTSMLSLWKSIYLLLPSIFSRICTLVVAIIFPSLTTRAKLSWLPKSEFSFVSLALPEPETAEGQPCIPVTSFREDFLIHNLWGKFQFLWWIGLTPKFWR